MAECGRGHRSFSQVMSNKTLLPENPDQYRIKVFTSDRPGSCFCRDRDSSRNHLIAAGTGIFTGIIYSPRNLIPLRINNWNHLQKFVCIPFNI